MTRRFESMDCIDELGDASVPFAFDVHAMIFSDDAPALEAALHRAFDDKNVNIINTRREFFHVTSKRLQKCDNPYQDIYQHALQFVRTQERKDSLDRIMGRNPVRQFQILFQSLPFVYRKIGDICPFIISSI